MRPRKRIAVLDEGETSLQLRCFALELWGFRAVPVMTAAELAAVLELERIDAVIAVLPRNEHRAVLRLAQELDAKVLTLDLVANATECQSGVSLASTAAAAEIREALRIVVARKRGPKNPGSVRWQQLQAARVN